MFYLFGGSNGSTVYYLITFFHYMEEPSDVLGGIKQ